jgi:hypothetical protein
MNEDKYERDVSKEKEWKRDENDCMKKYNYREKKDFNKWKEREESK